MSLVMLWLRAFGIEGEVIWQGDFGEEFGGSNPEKLHKLQKKHYKVQTEEDFLRKAAGWVYYENLSRPHYGKGMDGKL